MTTKNTKAQIGNKEIIFETGKLAQQANGSVCVRQGDTLVFASACASAKADPDATFFPLRVDYQEKFFSAGKTLGGFIKREGRPNEKDILVSRLIDRPLRPMFTPGYFNEVQILSYVWSYDHSNKPDVLAICAASAALTISDIPLIKPVGAVRVGLIDNEFIINPTTQEYEKSILDLVLAGTEDAILMIEGACDFLTEEQVLNAIEVGHGAIKNICAALSKWQSEIGKPKNEGTLRLVEEELLKTIETKSKDDLEKAIRIADKKERGNALDAIKEKLLEELAEGDEPKWRTIQVQEAYSEYSSQLMRQMILSSKKRSDGRGPTEIRPISVEPSLLPRAHGSVLFTRGETQSLAVATLGGPSMAQRFETLDKEGTQRFYLQYFFPPFSVGEVGRSGPANRREVGHGKLAERALLPVLPTEDEFPYTMRVESNIVSCNGSSSMASVCGGCLSLMDAGVPIKRPISGIAMGLILEGNDYVILSDIIGMEDALGDMDFKVTGDETGITAFQMDIKVGGITKEIMKEALAQAKEGRKHILSKMLEICPASRPELSKFAPRIETIRVKQNKIATIIGPSGKQIRAIIEETGVEINIDDDGLVTISSADPEGMARAKEIINGLVAEVEIGKTYQGKVISVVPFGAFIEILPSKEGLCHISELANERVENVTDVIKEGEKVPVKVLDINERGQIKLSRKALL